MSDTRKMKKVRIDEALIQQIDWYDLFPREVWSRQAKVNYLMRIGLGVLLEKFQVECLERQQQPCKPVDDTTKLIGQMHIQTALDKVNEAKLSRSEVARLLNRSLYE
jgi:hypothetical protein